MALLTNRFVLLLAALGCGISFLLGLISRVPLVTVFVRAILSGVSMGGLGFLFLFLLSRILPASDFEELLALFQGETPPTPTPSSVDSTDTSPPASESTPSAGSTLNIVEDSRPWEDEISPSTISTEETPRTSPPEESYAFDPAAAVSTPFAGDDTDEDLQTPSSFPHEEYNQLKQEYEKEKPTFHDNTVSFKVNDKKINTSPEIVAKAIKTILSRDS